MHRGVHNPGSHEVWHVIVTPLIKMANSSVDQFEVKGKVALVTGAAAGIGLAITKCLLKKGAKVCYI